MGNLTDLTTSWDGYLKSDVEDLIKSEFAKDKSDITTKYGATYFDQTSMIQYGFATAEDRDAWLDSRDSTLVIGQDKFEFSGKVRQLKVTSSQPTTLWFTTTADKAEITVGFVSQEKDITASS